MPQYINPNSYDLTLVGPDGEKVPIRHGRRVRLPDFFDRYVKKGFLQKVDDVEVPPQNRKRVMRPTKKSAKAREQARAQAIQQKRKAELAERKKMLRNMRKGRRNLTREAKKQAVKNYKRRPLGRANYVGATEAYRDTVKDNAYPISNGIGVGILSYNRVASLRRLIKSIRAHTDLRKTTIFISDDCSTDRATRVYLDELDRSNDFVVVRGEKRLGIAGNTNRLLRCLQRFSYKILLNDDVEILKGGWEKFYVKAMKETGYHHFCCRTPGVYGAKEGEPVDVNGITLSKVIDKPHGAVMVFDYKAFDKIGYFDEKFGIYGCEHIDWSDRIVAVKLQPSGYYDVVGSSKYFCIHAERSAVESRVQHLHEAREYHKKVAGKARYVKPSNDTDVPAVSYVIPCRDISRSRAILAVVDNIRAQRYPIIEIIISEQDSETRFKEGHFGPVKKILVKSEPGKQFNKSMAFNAGVDICSNEIVVLHDADTLVQTNYTKSIIRRISGHDSCFLGSKVMYINKRTSDQLLTSGVADDKVMCEKVVDYFEGGSIGVKRKTYWYVGGFNEEFWGYGCEDTDFYARLSEGSDFNNVRDMPLLHIWHPRTEGWEECHDINKALESRLKQKSIAERIKSQRESLRKSKYSRHI